MGVDDRDIVAAVAEGDADAFADLYDRHSPRAYSLLLLILNNKEEAEDALQEAFFDVWRLAERYDPTRAGVALVDSDDRALAEASIDSGPGDGGERRRTGPAMAATWRCPNPRTRTCIRSTSSSAL